MTPSFVESIASYYGIEHRFDADFMKLCWDITNKTHLEDMDSDELMKVAGFIEKRAADPTWGKNLSARERFIISRSPGKKKKRRKRKKRIDKASQRKHAELLRNVVLQPHQEDAKAHASVSGKGGQILNWGLGSGKTLGAFSIAEKRGGNVVVVTPASLRVNFREQFDKFVSSERKKNYHFFSYEKFRKNPEMIISRYRPKTLIVDEMHRLRNPNPREPFERIRHLVPYFVGLTGSLVNNRPEEMVPLVNLVAGKPVYKSIEDFKSRHIETVSKKPSLLGRLKGVKPGAEERPKNLKELGRRVGTVVHRFKGDPKFQEHVPTQKQQTIRVPMSPEQEQVYKFIAGKNPLLAWKIRHNLPPSKSELKNMNAFMSAMRQVSNSPAEFDKRVDTVEESVAKSPKFKRMLGEVQRRAKKDPNFRSVVFSNFLRSGVDPVVAGARARGVGGETFSGKLKDDERSSLVRAFNRGDFEVLGLSPAGGEGLDLKGVKLVQLTEPHWNPERSAQAIGRAARFKSHAHLPKEERQVLVQRFQTVHPEKWWHKLPMLETPMSSDEWIDRRRAEKEQINRRFVSAVPTYDKRKLG